MNMLQKWQGNHTLPNPFEEMVIGRLPNLLLIYRANVCSLETTQDDVHKELLAEEKAERSGSDPQPTHQTTASTFLNMGIELEHQQ